MIDNFFAWMFNLPGWVQLGIATVYVYLVIHLAYWHMNDLYGGRSGN